MKVKSKVKAGFWMVGAGGGQSQCAGPNQIKPEPCPPPIIAPAPIHL